MTVKELIDFALATAKRIVAERPFLHPAVLFLSSDGEFGAVHPPMGTPDQRDATAEAIREALAEDDTAVAYVVVMEAWASDVDPGQKGPIPLPSEAPNRKEIVAITAQARGEGTTITIAPILNGDDGKRRLGEAKTIPADSGRFTGLFDGPRPKLN